MRCGWLIRGLSIVLVLALHGAAQAAGADPWGAEIAKPEAAPSKPRARKAEAALGQLNLSGDRSATMAQLEVEAQATVNVFTLPNPYRVVVELTGTTRKPSAKVVVGHGLVERYHGGGSEAGKSRIVMETLGPVKATPFPLVDSADGAKLLEIALTPMSVQDFGQGSAAALPKKLQDKPGLATIPDFGGGLPGVTTPPARPVIVIDPGHGGIDPGAVGAGNLLEKSIVMAVAEELQQVLQSKGRYQVHMTRTDDVFVSLDQRVSFSRKNAASLFISLHADSIEQSTIAHSISGATVYTLSERASDEQARIMAEKENASDLLGGLPVDSKEDNEVKDILIDLIKRETASFSAEFAGVLRANLGRSVQLSRDPERSAAFKVLKQPHAPSVLVELGYMSNPDEAKRLNSPAWQKKVATAIGAAVDAYFSSRTARSK